MSIPFRRYPTGSFKSQLDRDFELLADQVRKLRVPRRTLSQPMIRRAGLESEVLLLNRKGMPVPAGKRIVAAVGKPWCMPELGAASLEIVTDALEGGADLIDRLWRQYAERLTEAARMAVAPSSAGPQEVAFVYGCGLQAGVDPKHWSAEQTLTEGVRYREATAYLTARREGFTFTIPTMEGEELVFKNPFSPFAASLTCGFSPNVQFPPSVIGLIANLSVATAFVAPAIASTSPFAAGKVGAYCSRVPMWRYGIDPEGELTAFATGGYFKNHDHRALLEYLEFVRQGEQVLELSQVGEGKRHPDYSAINLMIGTRWLQVCRLRFASQDGDFNIWLESRPWDAAIFPWDNMINFMLFVGLMVGLVLEERSAADYISYPDAEAAFHRCVQYGGEARVVWEGSEHRVFDLISGRFCDLAIRGLRHEGLWNDDTARAIASIRARAAGRNAVTYMRELVGELTRTTGGMEQAIHVHHTKIPSAYHEPVKGDSIDTFLAQ